MVTLRDPREIETIKRQPGKDMIIYGSGSIVSQLTQHGLIDEYLFVVCPVLLGKGQALLSGTGLSKRSRLLEARPLPSGDITPRYARKDRIRAKGGPRTHRCT
jgi:dihydrofolate reductase